MNPLKLIVALVAILFSSCRCDKEELVFSCPQPEPCYLEYGKDNKESNIIRGDSLRSYKEQVCSFGITACNEESKEIKCENIKYVREEICDNIDNDCNGVIDDGAHLRVAGRTWNNPCYETELGVCRFSEAVCSAGEWFCIPPSDLFGQEICDGKDNDCDGEVDEDIEETYVYDGSPETINVGECRAGVRYCEDGREITFGMVLPITEICGNEDDDDCDGLTDEREEEFMPFDFALLIDVSGSMTAYLTSVQMALCGWAVQDRFIESRFAIVAIGAREDPFGLSIITDFTDATEACFLLSNYLGSFGYGSYNEYQLDAIYLSMIEDQYLQLSWSPERERRVVMFTDELPQLLQIPDSNGIPQPPVGDKVAQIKQECLLTSTSISIFSIFAAPWQPTWFDIISHCNGYLEFMEYNPFVMIEKLNYWFGEEC
jgi:hypothetical protein